MNQTKKLIIILAVIAAFVGLGLFLGLSAGQTKQKYMDEYTSAIKAKGRHVIYIGRSGCSYCQQFSPILNEITKEYNVKYTYVNTDNISDEGLEKILKMLNINSDNFGTPYMVVVKDGKPVAEQSGFVERDVLFSFLQNNGMIDKDEKLVSEYANLTNISYSDYEKILESKKRSVIVIGQTGCTYCNQTKPIINEIAKEYNITINYLNLTELSQDDNKALFSSLSYLKDLENFGTPLTLVIEDKEVVEALEGYKEKSEFVKFLKKVNVIG